MMLVAKIGVCIVLLFSGVILAWCAYKSKNKTLKLNWTVGYRTTVIMTNQETWREAHFAAWPWTAASAVVFSLSGFGIFLPTSDELIGVVITAGVVAATSLIFVGAHQGQQKAKQLLARHS